MKPLDSWARKSSNPRGKSGHTSRLGAHLIAASGKFIGTFFFLWIDYSIVIFNQFPDLVISGGLSGKAVVYSALMERLSLFVNAWAIYRISSELFNPAAS